MYKKALCRLSDASLFPLLYALATLLIAGSGATVRAAAINPGFDFFRTTQPTFIDLAPGPAVNLVSFQGVPISGITVREFPVFETDTIVERTTMLASGTTGPITTQLVALNLVSLDGSIQAVVNQLGLPGLPLTPELTGMGGMPPLLSPGTLTVTTHTDAQNPADGLFNSILTVNAVCITPTARVICRTELGVNGIRWTHFNLHYDGLTRPPSDSGNFAILDPLPDLSTTPNDLAQHTVVGPFVPEPGSIWLLGCGVAALGILRRRRTGK